MKKVLILLLALVLVVGSFAGCGGGTTDEGDAATEVKIGINYELSGGVASYGEASVDGIMMAFDEINEAGGINGMKIVPVKIDNKSDAAEATSVATRLMTQEGVVACLGPATSGNFMATIPVAMGNSIPIISASATADEGVTTDAKGNVNEYVFRLCFNDSFQGVTMANFASQNLSAKKAVIIQDKSSDYAEGLAKNFISTFEASGGTIVAKEGYVTKDKDFNAILTKIKGQEFDVIFLPGYYQEAGLVIKQARDLGITAPILGADGFDSPVLLELAGAAALNDVYFSNHYSSQDEDPMVQDFIAAYKEKYGSEPNAFHALGYDLGKYIADAIQRAGSADPAAIKDALANTENFAGVTGTFSMGKDHNPVKSIVVIGLKDGVQATSVKVDPK
ncbi:ABC transporter substrate-binding protein [Sinanaerobacter chloroacetimidivorans]|jgi:branched-chain amino acid transport system substrate-binding protein|uniref:ABC transporter substrate-binding protein n=1 Tax=Sinanaerobacter chloroacetimidivorans TaxID=2818044 RepID=A0A8J7W3L0_9FIRM|nr:ABC transporter substrate-binding protein [Sinanaerobacter chloroacetimidivorans]MBR0600254.1 ABC transporter substrate-binding protein [Sinanaerobacter chloroacetimidivorans]